MEHLTDALDRLGVKTCPVCGKTGAKSLCVACRSVSYCGKACQKVAWPNHKRECRRIVRERAKIVDAAAAAYAADEAMAADACRPNIPPGAECYICKNDKYWKGDLVRGCSCRGPHAGFVHVRCLVANAEVKGEDDDDEFDHVLLACSQCQQTFGGAVRLALQRAAFLRYADRPETDEWRLLALENLGHALNNEDRLDEALTINMEAMESSLRRFGPSDRRTINAEEGLAMTKLRRGREADLPFIIKTMTRAYSWKERHLERDDKETLDSAIHVADAYEAAHQYTKAEKMFRETLPRLRRVHGESHWLYLWARAKIAKTLVGQRKTGAAREMHAELLPLVRRILGPDNELTNYLQHPRFFVP